MLDGIAKMNLTRLYYLKYKDNICRFKRRVYSHSNSVSKHHLNSSLSIRSLTNKLHPKKNKTMTRKCKASKFHHKDLIADKKSMLIFDKKVNFQRMILMRKLHRKKESRFNVPRGATFYLSRFSQKSNFILMG